MLSNASVINLTCTDDDDNDDDDELFLWQVDGRKALSLISSR